jgi:acetyl esterase
MAKYAFDPEVAWVVDLLPVSGPALPDDPLAAATYMRERASEMMRGLGGQDCTGLSVDDRQVAGHQGAPDVPVRIYRQSDLVGPAPCAVWIHGGGFFQGSIFEGPSQALESAQMLPLVAVDVEYRLAPEHPAPAAIEDCYAALCWVHENAQELNVDPDRVIIGGGSAGGGLAASLALMARSRGGPKVTFQVLEIPELDDRLETPSMREFVDTPMWNRPSAERSWQWYLGGDHDANTSEFAVPSRVIDLSGLPPAYISVMQFDPLRDEGIEYASRLLQAGVAVELHAFPGTFHGSAMARNAAVHVRERAELYAVIAKACNIEPPSKA